MTTLHTNDAITTIPRLAGLGIQATVLADSLRGVAAQRLVRKLCKHCASSTITQDASFSERYKTLYPNTFPKMALGCEACDNTGYQGRMPLFEIVVIDNILADAIRGQQDVSALRRIAQEQGNRTMSTIAKETIDRGDTSAEEIHRVLGEQFWLDIS